MRKYDSPRRNRVARETHNMYIDPVQPQIDFSNHSISIQNVSLISINSLLSASGPATTNYCFVKITIGQQANVP